MADVPLSLAIISTVTPVVAGGLPLTVAWIRDAGRDKRAAAELRRVEQERLLQERRAQCVELLRLARDFRVLVENTYESSGDDLAEYAKEVRKSAANIASLADEVEFMVPGTQAEAAALASAVGRLAEPVADQKNRELGTSLLPPAYTDFDRCLNAFKRKAQAALGDESALTVGVSAGTSQVAATSRPGLEAGAASQVAGRAG